MVPPGPEGPGRTATPADPPRTLSVEAKVTTIVDDLPQAGAIATKPTGQACLVIDAAGNAVETIDPSEPARRQRAIGPFAAAERPVAVGCIDSITAAVVTRVGREWTLKIYRLAAPGTPVESAATMQSIRLGEVDAGDEATVAIAVSPSRNWLVLAGLRSPLPPVMRCAIAGARLGGVGTRHCPHPEDTAGRATGAVTISPSEELVLFERAEPSASTDRLAMYATVGGTSLLSLDCGLPRVRAAVCSDDSLWVIAGSREDAAAPEGIWRLEATILDRRQAVAPVCIARLSNPVAMAGLPNGRLVVVHGEGRRTISLVEPAAGEAGQGRGVAPR